MPLEADLLEVQTQQDAVTRLMDMVHRALLVRENESVNQIRWDYTNQMRAVIRELEGINASFMAGKQPTYSQWKALRLDIQSAKAIAEGMNSFRAELVGRLEKDLVDFYRLSYNSATWVIDQTTPFNIDPRYNLPPGHIIALEFEKPWYGQRFSDRAWAITDEWAGSIQNQLKQSIYQGDSVREMAGKIRQYVGVPDDARLISRPRASAQLYRATTIARTEMIRAGRMAQDQVYADNADIIDDKVWNAKYGLLGVCEICRAKDGKTPSQIEAEGMTTDEHPNGRCQWIPKVKSWDELLGPIIKDIKATPGKLSKDLMLQPNEYGNWKPAKFETYQEWEMKWLTPEERGV